MIQNDWKDELYKYITGIIQKHNHKALAINGIADHIHIFFGMRPNQSLSDLMQDIKGSSSKWINERKFAKQKFEWQEGYGAFSYSKSQAAKVIRYIQNQETHHNKIRFSDEYKTFLEKYVFKEPE